MLVGVTLTNVPRPNEQRVDARQLLSKTGADYIVRNTALSCHSDAVDPSDLG